ncbi:MAG TPA: type II toxin-antitoxin system mRNA interferase toxin, RelE/StbE family [Candidatus Peribacteraceae bacterium]|nr:type II toxin-antitoxin system mRNA interferase toxin, RelE/StbE family [Candidatus Peribacteraceae bacterium]
MPQYDLTNHFLKDLKKWKRSGKGIEPLEDLLRMIQEGMWPPIAKYEAHMLTGNLEGMWDIHIRQNWVVLAKFENGIVYILRMGTHADLGL